jgi:hypothetical protein
MSELGFVFAGCARRASAVKETPPAHYFASIFAGRLHFAIAMSVE